MSDGSLRTFREDNTKRNPSATVPHLAQRLVRKLLDGLFPWICAACEEAADAALCARCLAGSNWIDDPLCPCCGLPLASPPNHLCGRCLADLPSFRRLRALVAYRADDEAADPVGKAIRALKYAGRRALAAPLSEILAERFPFEHDAFDVMAPVPLHVDRLRERGFNQAALLAREPARRLGVRLDASLLERERATPPQVGLGLRERRRNVRGAITVRRGRSVAGLRVLVVDDVCTSGATADACARALVAAGAQSVDVVALGRTIPH